MVTIVFIKDAYNIVQRVFYRHLGFDGFNIVLMKRFQPLYFHPNF